MRLFLGSIHKRIVIGKSQKINESVEEQLCHGDVELLILFCERREVSGVTILTIRILIGRCLGTNFVTDSRSWLRTYLHKSKYLYGTYLLLYVERNGLTGMD
jgi:hypothetical protein